jgi:hypothetical protein
MFTINTNNKTLSLNRKDKDYLVGFKTATIARHVMYNIHHHPNMLLVKENNLIIPKNKLGNYENNMYLKTIENDEFYKYPYTKLLGLIITNEIMDEDNDYITLNCTIMEPYFDVDIVRDTLNTDYNV